ncbi:MAG TPA: PAS domain S-box protein [Rhodopila sp.]
MDNTTDTPGDPGHLTEEARLLEETRLTEEDHLTGAGHLAEEASNVITRYRQIATAAMMDAESWLRLGALARAIPEQMPDALLVIDEAGVIISVNSQFELMFGYHQSEVTGKTPEMLLPEAYRANHVEQRRRFSESPRVRGLGENLGLIGRRKNGTEFKVLVKLSPVVIPAGVYTIAVVRRMQE